MTHLRAPSLLLLASLAATMSCGYAAAQDADKNPWMAEVAKAAADGRCDEAKTIALRNGSLDVAERVMKLCTPSGAAVPKSAAVASALSPSIAANAQPGTTISDPKPKSNLFARAKVISKNALSITIRHSDFGQKAAYQFATDHCGSFGKLAVQSTSGTGYGPDTTTTWICQEVPKSTP